MEEEQGSKGQAHENHFDAKDRMDRVGTADHDEFSHVPGGKREDKTGEEAMGDALGPVRKDDETKGQVHGKGESSWECQDVHSTTFSPAPVPSVREKELG